MSEIMFVDRYSLHFDIDSAAVIHIHCSDCEVWRAVVCKVVGSCVFGNLVISRISGFCPDCNAEFETSAKERRKNE